VIPLFSVSPECFDPPPRVNSAVVKLIPKTFKEEVRDKTLFEKIVREAFQHRRKTLKNALKSYLAEETMVKYGINTKLRPEELSVDDYVTLVNQMTTQ
jgi:16S rRNA (adenine1518-N6/adenine1519-N6)-dimethyltransferase